MEKISQSVRELDHYFNHTLKNVLNYPENYHVEIETYDHSANLILTSDSEHSSLSDFGFTEDPEGLRIMFEQRLEQFLKRHFSIKKIKGIFYEPESVIVQFDLI